MVLVAVVMAMAKPRCSRLARNYFEPRQCSCLLRDSCPLLIVGTTRDGCTLPRPLSRPCIQVHPPNGKHGRTHAHACVGGGLSVCFTVLKKETARVFDCGWPCCVQ